MTVTLSLSCWTGQKLDRTVTDEVLAQHQADSDAGKFDKNLVPPKSLEPIKKAQTRARQRHYTLTLPWGEDGVRILSAEAFFDYTNAMNEERRNCEKAVAEFLVQYPSLVASAPMRLGAKMFNPKDFPKIEVLRERFGFRMIVMPVPDGSDFRVALGAEHERQIRSQIEDTVKERYGDAQRELWERLLDAVKHFVGKMQNSDAIFRDSTVYKLLDIARIAPKLSLVPDPRLDAISAEILALASVSPTTLRENDVARATAAQKARDTLAKIESALQGAF